MPNAVPLAPSKSYRWSVLFLLSLAMLGNYYVYDCIAPIADLLTKQLGFTDANIGWLQAIYSIPNIAMVLLGGYVVDRLGTRKALFLFGVICFAGACITAISGKLAMMATGRLIFGLGAESLIVAVTTAIAKWFKGKELSFAFGANLTMARAGSLFAQWSPSWAGFAYYSWRTPLLISIVFASMCVTAAVFYWILEAYAEKNMSLGEQGSTDKVVFKDIFQFGTSYWYIVTLCIVFYSAIFPFQTFAYKFFMDVHGTTRETGGDLIGMLTICAMIGSPLFGLLADRIGRRATLMMAGSLLLIPVYLMMAYWRSSHFVTAYFVSSTSGHFEIVPHQLPPLLLTTMATMGIAFSLIPAVMWPSVAYLVDQSKLGTAYGLMTMIQNIGLAGFNILVGWANTHGQAGPENPNGYRVGMWIFSILGFLGLFFAFLLRQRETGPHGHGLESKPSTSPA